MALTRAQEDYYLWRVLFEEGKCKEEDLRDWGPKEKADYLRNLRKTDEEQVRDLLTHVSASGAATPEPLEEQIRRIQEAVRSMGEQCGTVLSVSSLAKSENKQNKQTESRTPSGNFDVKRRAFYLAIMGKTEATMHQYVFNGKFVRNDMHVPQLPVSDDAVRVFFEQDTAIHMGENPPRGLVTTLGGKVVKGFRLTVENLKEGKGMSKYVCLDKPMVVGRFGQSMSDDLFVTTFSRVHFIVWVGWCPRTKQNVLHFFDPGAVCRPKFVTSERNEYFKHAFESHPLTDEVCLLCGPDTMVRFEPVLE